jgi:hypothetical protein
MRRVILPAVIALLCSAFFGQRAPETAAPLLDRETQLVLPVGDLLAGPVNSTCSVPQSG